MLESNIKMYLPKTIYAQVALKAIKSYVTTGSVAELKEKKAPRQLDHPLACFVSIHLVDDSLRGCIGTLESQYQNLYQEIILNAVAAASRDSRFSPISKNELENLKISVDVLSKPDLVSNRDMLDPKKWGIIISDGHYKRGVLLPNLEGIDTVSQQIKIATRKAGLMGVDDEKLKLYRFSSTRYK